MQNNSADLDNDELPHVLIVDDDRRILALLMRYLQENGWRASGALTAMDARHIMKSLAFDALIVDVMMPEETGFEFVQSLRANGYKIPIIMLTAKAEFDDKIHGFELGVDDYITKPFSPRELELRLKRLISNNNGIYIHNSTINTVLFGSYRFDLITNSLTKSGNAIYLTERERQILLLLSQSPNTVVDRATFLDKISLDTRALDVAIKRLRDKIELNPSEPHFILTVRGIGFQLAGHGI